MELKENVGNVIGQHQMAGKTLVKIVCSTKIVFVGFQKTIQTVKENVKFRAEKDNALDLMTPFH